MFSDISSFPGLIMLHCFQYCKSSCVNLFEKQSNIVVCLVQAYVDRVNSKIFCFLALLELRVYCLLSFYGIYFDGIFFHGEGFFIALNETAWHISTGLSSNSCVNHFNKLGPSEIKIQICYSIFCSDPLSSTKI